MNKENTEFLFKSFPILYSELKSIDCRDSWFDLIYDLSKNINNLQDISIMKCVCGCNKIYHKNGNGKCLSKFILRFKLLCFPLSLTPNVFTKIIYLTVCKLNKIIIWFNSKDYLHRKINCSCKCYSPSYTKAVQIKEKFGSLRFYTSGFRNDKTTKLIRTAEEESLKVL